MSEFDAKTQAWIDEKEGRNYGGSADPEAIAAAVEAARSGREDALRDFSDQLTLDGVSRERTGEAPPSLVAKFGIPPFTVLDTRQGYWQERRRAWLSIGIRAETMGASSTASNPYNAGHSMLGGAVKNSPAGRRALNTTADEQYRDKGAAAKNHAGRKQGLIYDHSAPASDPAFYSKKTTVEEQLGRKLTTEEFRRDHYDRAESIGGSSESVRTGTSVFDPILCEIAYRWFCPEGGRVLDPFAGGSVRGIVAGALGLCYGGIELRAEQVEDNRAQADRIFAGAELLPGVAPQKPRWLEGDAADIPKLVSDPVDLVFTCPPYADLERYSDDPRDLSTMGYADFRLMYRAIIAAAIDKLRDDSYAVIIVSEVRDKGSGVYYGFVGDTVEAFEDAGAAFYNEAILVNSAGSAPIRANRMFQNGRKLVRVHQNFLVFCKGDWKKAAAKCRSVEE